MRTALSAVVFLLASAPVLRAADERYGPAEFFKLIDKSKTQYQVEMGPVKDPIPSEACDRRDPSSQRVEGKDGIRLRAWTIAPEAQPHFDKAEAFYKEKKFEQAGPEYAAAVKLDPGYAAGWLFSGDAPFGLHDWAGALAAYRKALEIDPSIAQAHRFAADALAHLGELDEAETEYIHAIAWDPAYKEAWQALENLGKEVGFRVEQHPFSPPAGMVGHTDKGVVEIGMLKDEKEAPRWLAYAICKAAWRFEPGFRAKRRGTKEDDAYAWSSHEEKECVEAYMEAGVNNAAAQREKEKLPPLEGEAAFAAAPADVPFLMDVLKAGMLDPYVIFEDFGRKCPAPFAMFPKQRIHDIEAYIRKFVVIHAGPARGNKNG
jgi:tetratricopeptide (TPR) repeat protein